MREGQAKINEKTQKKGKNKKGKESKAKGNEKKAEPE
jgi:hypothetical protein